MTNVERFIESFIGDNETVRDHFLIQKNSYWFAKMLAERFYVKLFYDETTNLFCVKINKRFYNASGIITNEIQNHKVYLWDKYIFVNPVKYREIYCKQILQITDPKYWIGN